MKGASELGGKAARQRNNVIAVERLKGAAASHNNVWRDGRGVRAHLESGARVNQKRSGTQESAARHVIQRHTVGEFQCRATGHSNCAAVAEGGHASARHLRHAAQDVELATRVAH